VKERVRECTADRRVRPRRDVEIRRRVLVVKQRLRGAPEHHAGGDTGGEHECEVGRIGVAGFGVLVAEDDVAPRTQQQEQTVTDGQEDDGQEHRAGFEQHGLGSGVDGLGRRRREQRLDEEKRREDGDGHGEDHRVLLGEQLPNHVDGARPTDSEQDRLTGRFRGVGGVRQDGQIPESGDEKDERHGEPGRAGDGLADELGEEKARQHDRSGHRTERQQHLRQQSFDSMRR